jgi:hypothetical protein
MAFVVRETVAVADGNEVELEVCDCAHVSDATARIKARDRFFTMFSNLGEIERFLIFSMVRDIAANEKNGKGGDFGNPRVPPLPSSRPLLDKSTGMRSVSNYGMNAMVPLGPTISAPPSGYELTALKV